MTGLVLLVARRRQRLTLRTKMAGSLFASIVVSGCVIVPIPHSKDIGQVARINSTDIGVLRRDEVLARWGEPTVTLEKERMFAYLWTHEGLMGCGSVGGRTGCDTDKTPHLILIQFDELGRVQRTDEPSNPPNDRDSVILTMREWAYRESIRIGATRSEIIADLGKPYVVWDCGKQVSEYTTLPGGRVLLIEYDESDRVARMERVQPWNSSGNLRAKTYRDFICDWARPNS